MRDMFDVELQLVILSTWYLYTATAYCKGSIRNLMIDPIYNVADMTYVFHGNDTSRGHQRISQS